MALDLLNAEDEGFELELSEEGDDGSSFRTQNDPSSPFQRSNITERKGAIDVRCVGKDVIHGYLNDGTNEATLIVYDFQFDSRKRASRITQVDIEFVYMSMGGNQPEVISIAPQGHMKLTPTTHTATVTMGGEAKGGANVLGAELGTTWKWEKAAEMSIEDETRVIGTIDLKNRKYGNSNAVSWTLLENNSMSTGVPAHLVAAVLLRRHDYEEFQASFEIKARANLTGELARLFARKPRDDPILYDPLLPPTGKLYTRDFDSNNLADIDLGKLSVAEFSNSSS